MRKITAFFMLFLLVGSSFIMFLPPISGQEVVSTEDGFTRVDDFVSGVSDTDWQKDTQFTANSEISVNGGDMVLDFDHESWQWNTMTYSNGTWVIHETRNVWGFGYIQYACNNNLEHVIKCWLRGDVSLPTDYRIGVSRGTWNPETNIYQSYNQKYSFNLTDVADYGFPITYDEDTSQIIIGVSGTFDIDPTITQDADTANKMRNDVVVTLGHFDYVFYKSGTWLQYMYKNSSESTWNNGSKVWATNRTEHTRMPQGVYDTAVDGKYPHSWKSNGTHIYGAIASKKYADGMMGRFFLFNVTKIGSVANVTHNYDIGSLVLHTNASIPCLGDAQYANDCGTWTEEVGDCDTSCFIDVDMNSTGFPMVMYSTDRSLGQGGTKGFSPAVMIAVAENPIGATCTEKTDFSQRPCNQNDARNGKNGTWTQPYQVDSVAKRIPGGSGHRYIWYTDSHNDHAGTSSSNMYQWEGSMCGMGDGKMLMMWHNRTDTSTNQGAVWARFWYQTNATWGSEFIVFRPTYDWLYYMDNIDLTCTADSSGTMTAHIVLSLMKDNCELNRRGYVFYTNLTDASVNPITSPLASCADMDGGPTYNTWCIRHFEHNTWALDVQITSDNSTGAVGIFYFTNRGDVFYNITGSHGNGGFSKTQALHSSGMCGLSGSSFIISSQWELNHMSMPMFFNGTVLDDSVSALMVFSCQNDVLVPTITGSNTILYQYYLNASVTANLIFYDQEGTPITIQNMTFFSNTNQTTLSVSSCSVCVTSLGMGTYSVDGIFRNGVDMDINGTGASPSFYIDLANTTASFVVGNMSLTFTFIDEVSLNDWDVSDKPLLIDIWTTQNNKMNQTTIDETGDLKAFVSGTPARIKVTFGDTYQYYRWNVSPDGCNQEGCDTAVTFYIPDYTRYSVQGYTWNFADQTQQYANGTILTRKYVSTGLIEIDHADLSVPANQIELFAILNHEYTLSAFSGDDTFRSDLGLWTAKTTTTINANIEATKLFEDIKLANKYVLWDTSRTICTREDIANNRNDCSGSTFGGAAHSNITIYFKDIANETSTVTFEIFNASGRVYSTVLTDNPGESTILWQGADTNVSHTYWVVMTAVNSRFGIIQETRPVDTNYNAFGPLIPLGRCPVCAGSLLDNNSPYYVYISMMILIFTVGLFSSQTAAFGAIITSLVAIMLYIFGWMPGMNPLILAFGTLMALLYAFATSRG